MLGLQCHAAISHSQARLLNLRIHVMRFASCVLLAGLDMANHSAMGRQCCFWQLSKGSKGTFDSTLELRTKQRLQPGQPLTISYAEDSNEALLFRYGFIDEANRQDTVMLRCPLGPSDDWDADMRKRIERLKVWPSAGDCMECWSCCCCCWTHRHLLVGA